MKLNTERIVSNSSTKHASFINSLNPYESVHPLAEANIYLMDQNELSARFSLESAMRLLDAEEKSTCNQIRSSERVKEFAYARAFTKSVLSKYTNISIGDVCLVPRDRFGKLKIKSLQSPLFFNLSHSAGLIALCVCKVTEVGVDLEKQDESMLPHIKKIANRSFSSAESKIINSLSEVEICEQFYRMWTLKEAMLKAAGIGLNCSIKNIDTTQVDDSRCLCIDSGNQNGKFYSHYWFGIKPNYHLSVASIDVPVTFQLAKSSSFIEQLAKHGV
ncbi:4'-phosphopantetheinyl transferase superfamily protein [Pleionea sp. CnH1-48]|uniref:4'-phosphopantetheinyl transferase family protein n=1 Tax=Pleionea sp. CnH1-48 TaxID=2954494 RepID=UPI00209864C9|nr:4'-phosphopantetheinyl transferase superfamily protein [Pleionea sp. CnH1-48]MCO7224340.1 4'-phosphopantetheinyl transferase superfamily protein [Pleionea sp. CnH1-48]